MTEDWVNIINEVGELRFVLLVFGFVLIRQGLFLKIGPFVVDVGRKRNSDDEE